MVRVRLQNLYSVGNSPKHGTAKKPIERQHSLQINVLATPTRSPDVNLEPKKPMRTDKQTEASRTNGAKLQGPKTPAGRAKSSQNGNRHNLARGHIVLLSNESPDQFKAFPSGYLDAFANCPPRAHPSRNAFHPNRGSRSAARKRPAP